MQAEDKMQQLRVTLDEHKRKINELNNVIVETDNKLKENETVIMRLKNENVIANNVAQKRLLLYKNNIADLEGSLNNFKTDKDQRLEKINRWGRLSKPRDPTTDDPSPMLVFFQAMYTVLQFSDFWRQRRPKTAEQGTTTENPIFKSQCTQKNTLEDYDYKGKKLQVNDLLLERDILQCEIYAIKNTAEMLSYQAKEAYISKTNLYDELLNYKEAHSECLVTKNMEKVVCLVKDKGAKIHLATETGDNDGVRSIEKRFNVIKAKAQTGAFGNFQMNPKGIQSVLKEINSIFRAYIRIRKEDTRARFKISVYQYYLAKHNEYTAKQHLLELMTKCVALKTMSIPKIKLFLHLVGEATEPSESYIINIFRIMSKIWRIAKESQGTMLFMSDSKELISYEIFKSVIVSEWGHNKANTNILSKLKRISRDDRTFLCIDSSIQKTADFLDYSAAGEKAWLKLVYDSSLDNPQEEEGSILNSLKLINLVTLCYGNNPKKMEEIFASVDDLKLYGKESISFTTFQSFSSELNIFQEDEISELIKLDHYMNGFDETQKLALGRLLTLEVGVRDCPKINQLKKKELLNTISETGRLFFGKYISKDDKYYLAYSLLRLSYIEAVTNTEINNPRNNVDVK